MTKKSNNQFSHDSLINPQQRAKRNAHRGAVIWFTGLSGSGKSTLAYTLEQQLFEMSCSTYVLDGDNVRQGLSKDLSFSELDRSENIRRVGEVAKLMLDAGLIVITAFISPTYKDREAVRQLIGNNHFIEVHCDASIEVCEARDTKGLYKKARAGEIEYFTGVSSPYEKPLSPEISCDTKRLSIQACVDEILGLLKEKNIFTAL